MTRFASLRFRPLSIASSCLPPSRSRFRFPPSVGGLDAWRRRFILRLPDRREFAYTESIKLTGSRFLRNPILRERHPYNSRNDQQRVNYLYALCSPVCNSAQVDSFTDRQRKTTPANALALRRFKPRHLSRACPVNIFSKTSHCPSGEGRLVRLA